MNGSVTLCRNLLLFATSAHATLNKILGEFHHISQNWVFSLNQGAIPFFKLPPFFLVWERKSGVVRCGFMNFRASGVISQRFRRSCFSLRRVWGYRRCTLPEANTLHLKIASPQGKACLHFQVLWYVSKG